MPVHQGGLSDRQKNCKRAAGAQERFVFRSFLLTTVHLRAQHAAEAAEAAGAQLISKPYSWRSKTQSEATRESALAALVRRLGHRAHARRHWERQGVTTPTAAEIARLLCAASQLLNH